MTRVRQPFVLSIVTVAMGSVVAACVEPDPWNPDESEDDFGANDDDTGDDDVVNETIPDVPEFVSEFLSPADLASLQAVGMTIYTGDDPPDVTGEYLLDSLVVTSDDMPDFVGTEIVEILSLVFANQTVDGALDQELASPWTLGQGQGAFIAGSGTCFTVFVDFEGVSGDMNDALSGDCLVRQSQLFSACVYEPGLDEFQFGFLMNEVIGDCDFVVPVGHRRILEESDGLAARQDGTSPPSEDP